MPCSTRLLVAATLLAACGPSLPPRYVVEADLGAFAYRRYQRVLDVEVPVVGNAAEGHTATYVARRRDGAEVVLATAFVTVYAKAASLTAEVRERLEELASLELRAVRLRRANLWRLEGDATRWLLWVSGRHLVKLGGPPGEPVPDALLRRYLALYPSDLDAQGRARRGAASAGPSQAEAADDA
ncbi:MAG: hypothetical protein AAF447_20520, partial [Myxococcota bacterium]